MKIEEISNNHLNKLNVWKARQRNIDMGEYHQIIMK
ncbi:unnamed protein product [Paramecium octaurelia]|uniref:Uncharacterized protein n=1 Tax=Paramecium octaurelia TaxID=43137 RepID=A0A8S1WZI1_PAROT|nr:unnamed protein product [Paramecium octaurelia]